ncbi:zinc transporter ZIP10-like [Pomacea canaliculata]|uniref:zinc transporter ZIP10-like n=1 Tax=Pomacea canaliculata TaxID=400727 RepID=UPI000D725EBC|nr:zinc transporter ZIP10-like [Pomacea canaliculata]XP_025080605.1 zinc transporter ZIP10-like [Pomacea canaliculata]XP_025080606.1 zinc transporter ZIP10-like [Pomacea canaliculata]
MALQFCGCLDYLPRGAAGRCGYPPYAQVVLQEPSAVPHLAGCGSFVWRRTFASASTRISGRGRESRGKGGHSSDSVWKGLVALVALVFFFVLERVLHVVTSQRAKRRQQKKIGSNISGLANDNGTSMMSPLVLTILPGGIASSNEISVTEKGIISDKDNIHDSYVSATADDAQHSNHNHGDPGGHGHGHGHAHLSEMPDSVAAVAWMVILGDGIHNFSDGLAIGAAFANSITGGFSTSVAVFCHELPHEIGDFAVLLSSGMTVKQGLTYNVLSSALCFLGMVAGMLLGQVKSASIWIFAAVGGMFLYISLADMLPQLSTAGNQSGKAAFKNLLVQCLGIVLGAAIMLTIAVFEEDLKNMLD